MLKVGNVPRFMTSFSSNWNSSSSTSLLHLGRMIVYLRPIGAILCRLSLALSVEICHLVWTKLICRWTIGLTHHLHLHFTVSKVLNSWYARRSDGLSFDRRMFSEFSWVISYQFLLIKLINGLVLVLALLHFLLLCVISNQNRLSKLMMLLLSDSVISSGVTISSLRITFGLEVLSYFNSIFWWWPLLEWKILWNKWNISHRLSYWLLLTQLHLSLRLISILYRHRISYRPVHLATIRWRIVVTNLGRLRSWLSLNYPVFIVLVIHHFVIDARHF